MMSQDKRVLVIVGSTRRNSRTEKAVDELCPYKKFEMVHLCELEIRQYDYMHELNADDDFESIVEKLRDVDVIVFASPVYWYSMSGRMKVFFDRMTELLSTYKDVGRSLRGKECWVIATGAEAAAPKGFEDAFRLTAGYFHLEYKSLIYRCTKT